MHRRQYLNPGWNEAEIWGQESEIAWQYWVRNDLAYTISYAGMHYSLTELGQVNLFLNVSRNGVDWEPIGQSPFYKGGISEVSTY